MNVHICTEAYMCKHICIYLRTHIYTRHTPEANPGKQRHCSSAVAPTTAVLCCGHSRHGSVSMGMFLNDVTALLKYSIPVCACVCMCVCVYLCVCVCVCVCVYVCVIIGCVISLTSIIIHVYSHILLTRIIIDMYLHSHLLLLKSIFIQTHHH